MTLRRKILWAVSPLLVALAIVSAVSVVASRELSRTPSTILVENFQTIDAAHEMRESLDEIERDLVSELVLGRPADEPLRRRSIRRFERALQRQLHNITEPGERETTAALATDWRAYRAALTGTRAEREGALPALRAQIQARLGELLRINRVAMREMSASAERDGTIAAGVMMLTGAVATLIALLVTGGLLRRLLSPLRSVDRGVRRIAEGDFDARLQIEGGDEVATLARSFNVMADHLAGYRNSSIGELMRVRRRLESVMDSLTDAVVLYDPDGQPLLSNDAAARVLATGWNARIEVLPAPLRDAVTDAMQRSLHERSPQLPTSVDPAVELPGSDRGRWWLVAAHPVQGPGDKLDGVTIALRDVSRARRAADFRGDLVAAAAHELRTPLTSLQMAVHLCLEEAPGPLCLEQRALLSTARDDASRLQTLVEEMLELARLEAGAVRLEMEPTRADVLVEAAVRRFEDRLRERGIAHDMDLPAPAPSVQVDAERIRSVFDNLLENALRHAGEGRRVELGAEALDGEVRFWIRDEGGGIPAELREHIFEKFVRVPGTPKRGTGLGLSIVRDVVQAHGGRVGVEDARDGSGSRFWFTLPRA